MQIPPFGLCDCIQIVPSEPGNFLSYSSIIQNLTEDIENQCHTIHELQQNNVALRQENAELQQTIKELRGQLSLNSKNSSKPPSSDYPKKYSTKDAQQSQQASDKKVGGQPGHKGSNLTPSVEVTETVRHVPDACRDCPHHDDCMNHVGIGETRHVIDAVVTVKVTAHESLVIDCPLHGKQQKGEFPDDIRATVQYGENLQALVVAMNTIGAVSVIRTHEILGSVFTIPLSTGTISNMVKKCASGLKETMETIRKGVLAAEVIGCDETGTKVNGKGMWVHTASTAKYTHLTVHEKRGKDGSDAGEVLSEYTGIVVHDCWAPYWKYDVEHGVCCAHFLRDLIWTRENNPEQTWANDFIELLLKMKAAKEKAIEKGHKKLSRYFLKKFDRKYDELIALAYEHNPPPIFEGEKKGRPKNGKVRSLVIRLDKLKEAVCLFVKNFAVPFDNNQAERDFRIVKTKTKSSGGFRTKKGADNYAIIMSYVGTAKKHKINPYEAILLAIRGTPQLIFTQGSE